MHRTAFNWSSAALRDKPGTVQQRIWDGLRQLEAIRSSDPCFGPGASVSTLNTGSDRVLALSRRTERQQLICLFNFSAAPQTVRPDRPEGACIDLITGEKCPGAACEMRPYQYKLLKTAL